MQLIVSAAGVGICFAQGAEPSLKADTGDTAWVLASSALVLAMILYVLQLWNGMSKPRSKARASSSVLAVVTMTTSMPRTWSTRS